MTSPIYILAGTAAQASAYMRQHNLMPSDIRYVASEDHLRGVTNPAYWIVGTFWDRADSIRIWERLKSVRQDGATMLAPPHIEQFLERQKQPKVPVHPCPTCFFEKPINEFCPHCGPPAPVLPPPPPPAPAKPPKFKHIKDVPKPKPTFKRIKP